MEWVCPEDREPLDPADRLRCSVCGRRFGEREVAVFGGKQGTPPGPGLEELWSLVDQQGSAAAAESYCRTHECSHDPRAGHWTSFLPLPSDGTLLEIGAGFGDDTLDLHDRVGRIVAVVPLSTNARILQTRLVEAGVENVAVAVVDDLTRLPLPDGAVTAVVIDQAGAGAWNLRGGRLERVAAEWRRVLAPQGAVLIGVANPLAGRLVSRLTHRADRDSFGHVVKRAAGRGHRLPRRGAVARAMKRQGFADPLIYAPLPSEKKTQLVIPVEDRRVVRYCLDHLVRLNSPAVRAAVRLAGLSVTLGLFPSLVPYHYLLFRRDRAG